VAFRRWGIRDAQERPKGARHSQPVMPSVREGTHAAVCRVFFDGAVYHVFNRLARVERVFAKSWVDT